MNWSCARATVQRSHMGWFPNQKLKSLGNPNSNNRSFNFVFERPHFRLEIGCFNRGSFRHFFCLCNQFCNFIIYLNRSNIEKPSHDFFWPVDLLTPIDKFWKINPEIFQKFQFSGAKAGPISGKLIHHFFVNTFPVFAKYRGISFTVGKKRNRSVSSPRVIKLTIGWVFQKSF